METESKFDFVTGIPDISEFRLWCENSWQEHLVEKESFGERVTYTRQEYFRNNKYFLKSQFKLHKSS